MIDKDRLDEIIKELQDMGFVILDKYEYEVSLEQQFLSGFDSCYEKYGLKQHEERW